MKKGFTLIELLGVIVILALLTLLVIPSIVNSVRDASEDTDDLTLELIYNASNLYISNHENNFPKIDGMKRVITLNELINDGLLAQPIKLSDKDITNTMSVQVVYNGRYTYELKENEKCVNTLCMANTSKVNALVWSRKGSPMELSSYDSQEVGLLASESGAYTPGVTYTCELGDEIKETFYVLEENENNISLISNRITSTGVQWISREDYITAGGIEAEYGSYGNIKGPITAMRYLKEATKDWTSLSEKQVSLPTAEQISNASGVKFQNINNFSISNIPIWLCSYVDEIPVDGYWTSTPYDSNYAWVVRSTCNFSNGVESNLIVLVGTPGIRPVITISKSQLG